MARYLVLDDSPTARAMLAGCVRAARPGAEVVEADNVRTALQAFHEATFDLAFLDVMMPGLNGGDALRAMREARPGALFVLVSGLPATHPDLVAAKRGGPFATLPKPVTAAAIRRVLDEAEGAPPSAP